LRERETARRAHEQLRSEAALELADTLGNDRGYEAELTRGAGKASEPRDADEGGDIAERVDGRRYSWRPGACIEE